MRMRNVRDERGVSNAVLIDTAGKGFARAFEGFDCRIALDICESMNKKEDVDCPSIFVALPMCYGGFDCRRNVCLEVTMPVWDDQEMEQLLDCRMHGQV